MLEDTLRTRKHPPQTEICFAHSQGPSHTQPRLTDTLQTEVQSVQREGPRRPAEARHRMEAVGRPPHQRKAAGEVKRWVRFLTTSAFSTPSEDEEENHPRVKELSPTC